MKNILVITGGFPTASQTFVTREVASMLDKGFNVTVLCSNEGDDMGKNLFSELECQRCKVICVDFFSRHLPFTKGIARTFPHFPKQYYGYDWTIRKLGYFNKVIQKLSGKQYDLIHAHFLEWGFNVALPLSKLLRVPFTVTVHDSHLEKYQNSSLHAVQKESVGIALVSDSWKTLWVEKTNNTHKLTTIYNGVEPEEFSIAKQSDERPIKIILVSRLTERKRVAEALEAMAVLIGKGYTVTLDVLGDGPLMGQLTKKRDDLGLQDIVTFHGFCPHKKVREMMARAHLFWHCSAYESFGIVIVEAMMCALPVVVANSPGAFDVTAQGAFGKLYEPNDINHLVHLTTPLLTSSSKRITVGTQLRDYSIAKFSWSLHMNTILSFWRFALKKSD